MRRSEGEITVHEVVARLSFTHSLYGSSGSFSSMDLKMTHELNKIPVALRDILPVMV